MSYNIDSSEYLSGCLSILVGDKRRLANLYAADLPECCFLTEKVVGEDDFPDETAVKIDDPRWYGFGSGNSVEIFTEKVAQFLIGEADILLVWEGGDSQSGWRVRDGVAAFCAVKIVLEPEES